MAPTSRGKPVDRVLDFAVLALHFQPPTNEAAHYVYLRANAPKVPTEDTPRELFLVNVPVDATETHLRALFAEQLGGARVEEVVFEDRRVGKGIHAPVVHAEKGKKRKRGAEEVEAEEGEGTGGEVGLLPQIWDRDIHRSGATAVVRFVDRASAERALKEVKRARKARTQIIWNPPAVERKVPLLGSARYLAHHGLCYPDPALLQSSVDAFMAAFSAQESERARLLARQRSEPDEDGFITVTRGGRHGPAREEGTRAKEEELRKREKERVKDDFYRFQVREKKKGAARDLVKGFEEDRKRVEEMRRRRGRVRPE